MSDDSFRQLDPDDARAAHEAEQTHAKAIERLRGSKDFMLFTFEVLSDGRKGWRITAALGQEQDLDSMTGLVEILNTQAERIQSVIESVLNQQILDENIRDWKTMDDDGKEAVFLLLSVIFGQDRARDIIRMLEAASDDV